MLVMDLTAKIWGLLSLYYYPLLLRHGWSRKKVLGVFLFFKCRIVGNMTFWLQISML